MIAERQLEHNPLDIQIASPAFLKTSKREDFPVTIFLCIITVFLVGSKVTIVLVFTMVSKNSQRIFFKCFAEDILDELEIRTKSHLPLKNPVFKSSSPPFRTLVSMKG